MRTHLGGPWRRDEPSGLLHLGRLRVSVGSVMGVFLQVLLVAGGLLPLAAMLSALFAAVWIREGRRDREAADVRSRLESR